MYPVDTHKRYYLVSCRGEITGTKLCTISQEPEMILTTTKNIELVLFLNQLSEAGSKCKLFFKELREIVYDRFFK